MSMKYLGKTIDIHGGGLENQFPHHECEIAQSEAANGIQFVRYWMHNNMVTVDGQKMGKSLDNFINLKQVFSGSHARLTRVYKPLAVRQLILNSHYKSPLDFSDAALFAAQSGYEKITAAVIAVRKKLAQAKAGTVDKNTAEQLKSLQKKFEAAMDDDLNTSIALSVIFELVRFAKEKLTDSSTTAGTLEAIDNLFDRLGGDCLGIVKDQYPQAPAGANEEIMDKLIGNLIDLRNQARAKKDFATSDAIRDNLKQIGIVLEDKPSETVWRRQ
jgi:cysteinyl-tRNA synthetase